MLQDMVAYIRSNVGELVQLFAQHVGISAVALVLALILGALFGFLSWRFARTGRVLDAIFQTLRVIPSLAILLLLIPLMGTGVVPALVALVLLALPPILMGVVQGLQSVSADVLEAADGVGMTKAQQTWRVRIPLAAPAVFTGAKTAAIEVIASATLAAKIGAGGLGELIFTGLGLARMDLVLVGAVCVALLSLATSLAFELLERVLLRWYRPRRKGSLRVTFKQGALLGVIVALVCGLGMWAIFGVGSTASTGDTSAPTNAGTPSDAQDAAIRVGSKDFTENMVVGEVYALALEDAGYQVQRVPAVASSVIHTSITSNQVDLYPEYTGTGLLSVLQADVITDPQQVYDAVKQGYQDRFNITWLDYAQANDGQGLVIRTSVARDLGIFTISDLQQHASEINFASQGEFNQRQDGLPALEATYGAFNWKSSKVYDNGLKYEVLKSGEADVSPAYTTEGQLVNTDEYTLLKDDKQVWPPYNLAPVVRDEVLVAHPGIADVLNRVSERLDTKTVTSLNAAVDVDKREYDEVAREFYESIRPK